MSETTQTQHTDLGSEGRSEWVLVPREPTPKMVHATWNDDVDVNGGIESQNVRNKRVYRAMIAAAPSPDRAGDGGDLRRVPAHLRSKVVEMLSWSDEDWLLLKAYFPEDIERFCKLLPSIQGQGDGGTGAPSSTTGLLPKGDAPDGSSSQATAIPSRGWSTIADCPSDGRMIWVFGGRHKKPSREAADGSWWRHEAKSSDFAHVVPTHWMPDFVPAPPSVSDRSGEAVETTGSTGGESTADLSATPKHSPEPNPPMSVETAAAIADCADAVAFFDKVRHASSAEQVAVGTDHWNWLEAACRRVAALSENGEVR